MTQPPRPVPTPETAVPYGEGGPVSGPYGSVTTANYKGGFSFQNADFGGKYGWYVDGVKRRVQQNWLTYEIDPRIKAPHRAYIEFDITRDGSPSKRASGAVERRAVTGPVGHAGDSAH